MRREFGSIAGQKLSIKKTTGVLCLIILYILFFYPLFVTIIRSVQTENGLSFASYRALFSERSSYLHYYKNSFRYALTGSVTPVLFALPPAIWFGNFRKEKSRLFLIINGLCTSLPVQAMLLPQYLILRSGNLLDTPYALILPFVVSPLAFLVLYQFARQISRELQDIFLLESHSMCAYLRYLIFRPMFGISVLLCILLFCLNWNMVEQPVIFCAQTDSLWPLSLKLSSLPETTRSAGEVLYFLPPLGIVLLAASAIGQIKKRRKIRG